MTFDFRNLLINRNMAYYKFSLHAYTQKVTHPINLDFDLCQRITEYQSTETTRTVILDV